MVAFDVDDNSGTYHYNDTKNQVDHHDHDDQQNNIHSFHSMSRPMLLDNVESSSTKSKTMKERHQSRKEGRPTSTRESALDGSNGNNNNSPSNDDIYENGTWGVISRRDKLCFLFTLLLLICGIIMGFVYAIPAINGSGSNNNSNSIDFDKQDTTNQRPGELDNRDSSNDSNTNNDGIIGTSIGMNRNNNDIMYSTPKEQYDALRNTIVQIAPETITSQILLYMPDNYSKFESDVIDSVYNDYDNIYHKAMIWFLYNDTVTIKYQSELVSRYVLIVTYLHNNGSGNKTWTHHENWMTNYHSCLWYGIRCNSNSNIIEIDLSNNGLSGNMHLAWSLLYQCQSILFNSNSITGTIPGIVFGNIISLEYLYLQENMLSGTVPTTLKSLITTTLVPNVTSSSLNTLFVQGNPNLTGTWPIEFCPSTTDDNASSNNNNDNNTSTDHNNVVIEPIYFYGMDCNAILCSCCDPAFHCFN